MHRNPATEGFCSKCYRDKLRREEKAGDTDDVVNAATNGLLVDSSASAPPVPPPINVHADAPLGIPRGDAEANVPSDVDVAQANVKAGSAPSLRVDVVVADAPDELKVQAESSSTADPATKDILPEAATTARDMKCHEPVQKIKKKKKRKNRCGVCRKKLMLTAIMCRCEKKFCSQHRYPSDHNCTFDYKSMHQGNLKKQLVSAKPSQLGTI